MFTGIVESMGTLLRREALPAGERYVLSHAFDSLGLGDSVACSGACLTVVAFDEKSFSVDLSPETLDCTILGGLQVGDEVNFERAMQMGDRLGGHLVTGHVDGVGEVTKVTEEGDMTRIDFRVGKELGRYTAQKGSITIDGVSLTINTVTEDSLSVMLIPHTREVTTLGRLALGTRVNLEVDLVARYVERLLQGEKNPT